MVIDVIDSTDISIPSSSDSLREMYRYDESKWSVIRSIILTDGSQFESLLSLPSDWNMRLDPYNAFDWIYLRKDKRPRVRSKGNVVRVVDLFSGCGGLSLGAWEACRALGMRFNSVMALDNDKRALDVYERNFPYHETVHKDINKFIDGNIGSGKTNSEKELIRKVGEVDLLLSGPPCQGYSNLNNHTRRKDERNGLYSRVVRFAEIAEPKHIIIENVPEIKLDEGRVLQDSVQQLRELEYFVDHDKVDLSAIGVPQRRKRHVLVASKTRLVKIKDVMRKYDGLECRRLKWAIFDLRMRENGSMFDTPSTIRPENAERIQYLFDNKLYNLPNQMRPPCHRNGHTYISMYGRLSWKERAPTITTGFLSPGQGRYIHPSRRRTLTPHEAARVQFFPDFFDFSTAPYRDSLKKMIGNAAPMKLAYVFALELLS